MNEDTTKGSVPTPEKLEREARRLARSRHLTLVREAPVPFPAAATTQFRPDPEPKTAA
jgi:hypothetical protein